MNHAADSGIELRSMASHAVPVNVVMGELGSGKTTVILGLVKQIAGPQHKVIWLKNEYGDVNVDGALAKEQGITTEEIMNGCLCCTAIGQLENAVAEVLKLDPDRIIIETAGTAHPAPIAMELKRFPDIIVDSFIEVIDCLNFRGFADTSVIGQSHAKYIDFIVLNKVAEVDDRRMDEVLDRVNDNYSGIPRTKTADGSVPAALVLGLAGDAAVASLREGNMRADAHSAEAHAVMRAFSYRTDRPLDPSHVESVVKGLSVNDVYRVKGIIHTPGGWKVMNSVANRMTWQDYSLEPERTEILFIGPYADDHEEAVRRALDEGTTA